MLFLTLLNPLTALEHYIAQTTFYVFCYNFFFYWMKKSERIQALSVAFKKYFSTVIELVFHNRVWQWLKKWQFFRSRILAVLAIKTPRSFINIKITKTFIRTDLAVNELIDARMNSYIKIIFASCSRILLIP